MKQLKTRLAPKDSTKSLSVEIHNLRNELEEVRSQLEKTKAENGALQVEVEKKDEAIRRLREVTLGS